MTLHLSESKIYNPPALKTTKTKPKNIIHLHFANKAIDVINISKIVHDKTGKKTYLHNSTKKSKL